MYNTLHIIPITILILYYIAFSSLNLSSFKIFSLLGYCINTSRSLEYYANSVILYSGEYNNKKLNNKERVEIMTKIIIQQLRHNFECIYSS